MNQLSEIQLCPLGSGSKGNCTFVGTPHGALLVDAGFSVKDTLRRLCEADLDPSRIRALLITHEHSDHVKSAGPLARALSCPIYLTKGTHAAFPKWGEVPAFEFIEAGNALELFGLEIEPLPLPHDAAEPVAFAFSWGGRRWAVLTDFGFPTRLLLERLRHCDLLLVEANHDEEMLLNGPYPWHLKTRIRGRMGHLSNTQSLSIIQEVLHPGLQAIALLHLSETNNRPELPYGLVRHHLLREGADNIPVHIAPQGGPLPPFTLLPR